MNDNKKIVLVISNELNHEGGISSFYETLFKNFSSENFKLKHLKIGSRQYFFNAIVLKRLFYIAYYLFDFSKYIFKLSFNKKIKILQFNPSLIPLPLLRDGIFIIFNKLFFKKRTIIFFRGWKIPTLKKLVENQFYNYFFQKVFLLNNTIIVLAKKFKSDLGPFRQAKDIHVTTTTIDKNEIIYNYEKSQGDKLNVLFLSRVQDLKGIDELVEAIILLHQSSLGKDFNFTIAGHESVKGYIDYLKNKLIINNIDQSYFKFTGRVDGEEKFKLFAENDIYILPSYTEGCPNSVLEALSSGLFCITSRAGALPEIINSNNGILIDEINPDNIINALKISFINKDKIFKKRKLISKEAIDRFDIENIIKKLNKIYNQR